MKDNNNQYFISNRSTLIIIISITLFFPLTAYYIKLTHKVVVETKSINIPIERNGWKLVSTDSNILNSKYTGADKISQSLYRKEKYFVNHYFASYYNQSQQKELISEQNSIYDSNNWKVVDYRKYSEDLFPYCGMQVNELVVLSKSNQSRLVWYQYNVAGIFTHSKYIAKLLAVWDILFKKQGSQVVILSIEVNTDLRSTRDALRKYVIEMQMVKDLCGSRIH